MILHSVVADVIDSDVVISEFKPRSHNYIHFRTITFGINSANSVL